MYPEEYIQYLTHFHGDRDYFECHEILEEYWKNSNDYDKDSIWVALILTAVSTYHHRRQNFKGAKRTLGKAIKIFSKQESELEKLGLDKQLLFPLLDTLLEAIKKEENYKSPTLPIKDPELLKACLLTCERKGITWGKGSNLENTDLVHKHKQRDRSGVIEERLEAIKRRKGNES